MTRSQFIEQAALAALRSGATGFEAASRAASAASSLESYANFKFHREMPASIPGERGPDQGK